jgi:hypothetical protein
MGYTFTFGDIEKICRALKMSPAKKGSQIWRGMGPDGGFRQTRIDSHGSGKTLATGAAKRVAQQLGLQQWKKWLSF